MKKLLITLGIVLPFFSTAQKFELSLKGGIAPNTFIQKDDGMYEIQKPKTYCGSISATVGLPKKFRAGLSVSAYKLEYSSTLITNDPQEDFVSQGRYRYGNPIMPVELMLLKRFDLKMISLDAGLTGGMSVNKKMLWTNDPNGDLQESKGTAKGTWYTYGVLLAGQVNISKRFAVGAETQVKRQHMGYMGYHRIFIAPVMLKASVRI